jgi:hypothetical protein
MIKSPYRRPDSRPHRRRLTFLQDRHGTAAFFVISLPAHSPLRCLEIMSRSIINRDEVALQARQR